MKIDVDDEPEAGDELCVPANDKDAAHLARLTALSESSLQHRRKAIGLAYAIGRNTGRLEGAEKTSAAWQASIDRFHAGIPTASDLQQPSDASASTATKREE